MRELKKYNLEKEGKKKQKEEEKGGKEVAGTTGKQQVEQASSTGTGKQRWHWECNWWWQQQQ